MDAVNSPAMPSQGQMAYAQRTTNLHRTSHAQPSSEPGSSPYKPRLPLPSPSSHPYGAPPTSASGIRFVSHFSTSSGQLHYRQHPPYNAHMIVRENLPPPGSRIDNAPSPSSPQVRGSSTISRIPLIAAQPYMTNPALGNDHPGIVISSIDLNPPAKKLRLSDQGPQGLIKADLIQPLRIETRDHSQNTVGLNSIPGSGGGPGSVYNPQVEAISPTLPPDPVKEDNTLKTVKDELIGKIGKVDKEIASTESLVTVLKEKEKSLEESLKRLLQEKATVKGKAPTESLAQLVYKKNRELAAQSHEDLLRLGVQVNLPVYNQPMDTAVFLANREKYQAFRPRLVEIIQKRKQEETARQTKLTETYCSLATAWFKKVEKIENSNKRKSREAKSREVYEKMFPEIRKNREDKERFSRVGARVKSDADLAEIMDGLQEQEAEDRRRHSLSVIPPIICDVSQAARVPRFLNRNGRVQDYGAEIEARAQAKMWTQQEREIFRDKYIHHQKNFGLIASFLERKTVSDCVEYYYLSKKRENYKRAIRYNKSRARTRGKGNLGKGGAVNSLNPLPLLDPIFNTAGVTTRLQREQLIKQEVVPRNSNKGNNSSNNEKNSTNSNTQGGSDSNNSTPIKEETPVHLRRGPTLIPSSTATTSSSSTTTTATSSSNNCDIPPPPSSSSNSTTVSSSTSSVSSSKGPFIPASSSVTSSGVSSSTTVTSSSSHTNSQGHPSMPVSIATVTSAVTYVTNNLLLNELTNNSSHPSSNNSLPPSSMSSGVNSNASLPTSGFSAGRKLATGLGLYQPPPSGAAPPLGSGPPAVVNHHHYNSTGELRLELKKKERRKEDKKKEGEFDDTSDDEVLDNQELDKLRAPHECHVCHKLVTASRRLPRSHAPQYGLTEEQIPLQEGRVCAPCRLRHRFTCCPIPSCVNHTTQRAKRLRTLPSKFHSLPPHLKSTLAAEFEITPSITKCCSLCYTRVQKRLVAMGIEDPSSRPVSPSGGSTSPLLRWTEEETEALKKGLRECGTKWTAVSTKVGPSKTSHQCKSFYFNCKKSMGLDLIVQEYNKIHFGVDRKPALTDEEESGSSTSSCDGLLGSGPGPGGLNMDSDTASAPSPSTAGPKPSPHPPRVSESSESVPTPGRPPSNHLGAGREDYDSSTTETADESTVDNTTNSPLTVKDLMLGVIEISLKNSQADPSQISKNNPPTISSILKSSEAAATPAPGVGPQHLAPPPPQTKPISMVQQPREAEPVTLDLSIKKPRGPEPSYPPPSNKPALALPHSVMYRPAPDTPPYSHYTSAPTTGAPEVYGAPPVSHVSQLMSRPPTPSHLKPNKVRITSLSPGTQHPGNHRLSPSQAKLSHPSAHSPSPRHSYPDLHPGMKDLHSMKDIHHLKDLQHLKDLHVSSSHAMKDLQSGGHMKESPGGSITQGTPVHTRPLYPPPPDGRGAPGPEFYGKPAGPGSAGPPNPAHRASDPHPQPRSSSNPSAHPPSSSQSPFYPPRAPTSQFPSSVAEQQQILMSDYLTAKQMHGSGGTPSPGPLPGRSPKSTPPSSQTNHTPASGQATAQAAGALFYPRQGVIQRHATSKPPSPHTYPPPPGHEAFSSLVDVAVRQPSLPVPGDHKSNRASLHEGLGQRFNNTHDRYPPPSAREQQERFARESVAAAAAAQQQREREASRERERELVAAREQQMLVAARDRELQHLRDQAILREQHIREMHLRDQQQKQMIRDNQIMQQQQREREQLMHLSRERELIAARLNTEQQARIHQMQMQAFAQQQQHYAAAQQVVAAQREAAAAAAQQQQQSGGDARGGAGGSKASSVASSGSGGSEKHANDSRPQLVTAASLIDAIITHQINQPVDQAGPGERGHLPPPNTQNHSPATRPGDRLFQVDFNQKKMTSVSPLDPGAANGKLSPASSLPANLMTRGGKMHSPEPSSKAPPGMMSLNEQIESMISRGGGSVYHDQQAWKLRRALQQQKEEEHRKQASPGRFNYEPSLHLSPLDYVKTRIAEVMRTSEDDRAEHEGSSGPTPPPPRSLYSTPSPYSMMQASPRPPSRPVLGPPHPQPPPAHHDPSKPLMSDQFDALSDDD